MSKPSGKTLNQSLDIILGDMSIHVKTKILMWDEQMVNKIHTLGETEIAQEMLEIGAKFMLTESDDDLIEDNRHKKIGSASYAQGGDEKENANKAAAIIQSRRARSDSKSRNMAEGARARRSMQNRKSISQGESLQAKPEGVNDAAAAAPANMSNANLEIAADMKFAKTVKKLHNSNPKLFRFREMNRHYKVAPS